jgi:fatty acid desaturase
MARGASGLSGLSKRQREIREVLEKYQILTTKQIAAILGLPVRNWRENQALRSRKKFKKSNKKQSLTMDLFWTVAVVLVVLWLLGVVSSVTIGGLIHALLVIAIVIVAIRLIQGKRPW